MQNSLWTTYSGQDLSVEPTIHIFKLKIDDYSDVLPTRILSTEELNKANRFYHQKDKESYIIRKFFLRVLLDRVLKVGPTQIYFNKTDNKKPFLTGVHFNTSHSKNFTTIAISRLPVGIDIEYLDRNLDFNTLLRHCFSQEESAYILSIADPFLGFYTLWTKKEALLKATGEGLVEDLNQVQILEPIIYRNEQAYQIQSIQDGDYLISIANTISQDVTFRFWDKIESPVFSIFE